MIVNGIRYARKCNECGEGMNEGYVTDGGCEHYCSDACLHKHVSADEFDDLHDDGDGDSYWTEWEDQNDWDDDDEEEEALRVATTRDYQALAQERKRREKMVRDAAHDLLAALLPLVEASPVDGGMIRFDGDELRAARNAIAKAQAA
jgi:hypothetical protein